MFGIDNLKLVLKQTVGLANAMVAADRDGDGLSVNDVMSAAGAQLAALFAASRLIKWGELVCRSEGSPILRNHDPRPRGCRRH